MLNKQKGNMYDFVTHTWNPIKGKCEHNCQYCYMKKWPQKPIRLDQSCFQDNLGSGNTIFVGSSTDMFAKSIPDRWIDDVLSRCRMNNDNTYLFQSKNPKRFSHWLSYFPDKFILATTIESNKPDIVYKYSKAPSITSRLTLSIFGDQIKKMVTIEPIMEFDLEKLYKMIKLINPFQVNIGADSGNNNLPEPSIEKIWDLADILGNITEVHIKGNLNRLIKGAV